VYVCAVAFIEEERLKHTSYYLSFSLFVYCVKKTSKMNKEDRDLESVYVSYWERLQHSLFLSFLLVATAATTTFLGVALAYGHVSLFTLLLYLLVGHVVVIVFPVIIELLTKWLYKFK